jgi:hypothetical protein
VISYSHNKGVTMRKGFKKINDSKVTTVWKSTCDCGDVVCEVELHPCDFVTVGVPICQECGVDFKYVETLIKVK